MLGDIEQVGDGHLQCDTDLAIEIPNKCLVKHTYILLLLYKNNFQRSLGNAFSLFLLCS